MPQPVKELTEKLFRAQFELKSDLELGKANVAAVKAKNFDI